MTTSPFPLLRISNLHVACITRKKQLPILRGVNLELFPGESFALIGESGSGKSITAQSIIRLLAPQCHITDGEIWFNDEPLHSKTPSEMQKIRGKHIGMIFQDPMTSLNPTMRVGAQIRETFLIHTHMSKHEAHSRAIELLALVGIADPVLRAEAYPFQLSGGMRQRVMIAMALACSPKLLIADEPTTALDITIQAQILDLLQRLQKQLGMTLLLITHDLGIVAEMCTRAAVMQQGVVVETGTINALLNTPQHPYTRTLLSAQHEALHI